MFEKRVKIFIITSGLLLLGCILRLAQMQLLPGSTVQASEDLAIRLEQLSFELRKLRG